MRKEFERVSYEDSTLDVNRKRLDPELKQTWLEALRSGEYQQGKGKLERVDNECCCLGVLCNVLNLNKKLVECHTKDLEYYKFSSPDMTESANYLPAGIPNVSNILECSGLLNVDILFNSPKGLHGYNNLADLNDNGATFEEIAWLIEEIL